MPGPVPLGPDPLAPDPLAAVQALVEGLRAENARLRGRIEDLEALLATPGGGLEVPLDWRLTLKEARLFGVLMRRELASKQMILDVLYGHLPEADEPNIKIVDVFVCKARKKLDPLGIRIETVWGHGYRLSPATKARVSAMLSTEARAA